ncbi:MAG: TetR/AcrR family transcriptional regulator [Comamonas sp.]|nr:TetR/AcrR family transcriptional regulator [Comamonas sp.]
MKPSISRHTQTDTRALILKHAQALLLTRSYLGLSFQDLANHVGIRKASLYHHFASKEALGIALIDATGARFMHWAQSVQNSSGTTQLQAYVQMFRDGIGAGQKVCPIGATGGEWDCLEPALQDRIRQLHLSQLQWLTATTLQLDSIRTLKSSALRQHAAAARAHLINALCQGAMLSARLHASAQVFDAATTPLNDLLQ